MDNRFARKNGRFDKSLIIISIVYLLSQGFILVLTGTWWDEKTWFFASKEQIWDTALQLGKPSLFVLFSFITSVPQFVGQFLIFLLFYIASLGMFMLYKQIPFIDEKDAMYLTLIYISIPVNDARALRGVFPYSLGYFFFVIGFCCLVRLQTEYEYKHLWMRILTLGMFILSFTLNSNLVFYAIPLMYIITYLIKERKLHLWYEFIDFICIPFLFFFLKNKFFPAYGIYEGYNEVSFENIFSGIFPTVRYCVIVLTNIIVLWKKQIMFGGFGGLIFFLICVLTHKKKEANGKEKNRSFSVISRIVLMVIGCAAAYLGIFPYAIMDQANKLTGVSGRSSILVSVGVAVIIYSLIIWIPHETFRTGICYILIVCGICHFNNYYLLYQQDYYRQMDLIYELQVHKEELNDKKNILYITDYEPEIYATRFYTLNSNAAVAFNDQTHFIMNGINDISILRNYEQLNNFVYNGDYQMKEYQIGRSSDVEAILYYHDGPDLRNTGYLKLLELTNYDKFEKELYGDSNLDIFFQGSKQYLEILDDVN